MIGVKLKQKSKNLYIVKDYDPNYQYEYMTKWNLDNESHKILYQYGTDKYENH